jgi:hypothetical protein
MRIGGFQLPKINLGNILAGGLVNSIKQSLQKAAGDFLKSGFEAFKKTLGAELGKLLGIKPPTSVNIGAPGAPNGNTGVVGPQASGGASGAGATGGASATGGAASTGVGQAVGGSAANLLKTDPKEFIRRNMGDEAAAMYDQVPQEQKNEMAMQAAVQRTARISQLMSNLLQTMHDMSKTIIQNTRG